MYHMKVHEKCNILAHSKFMETHFGPNEPAAFCALLDGVFTPRLLLPARNLEQQQGALTELLMTFSYCPTVEESVIIF
jgi:hypothetical protein